MYLPDELIVVFPLYFCFRARFPYPLGPAGCRCHSPAKTPRLRARVSRLVLAIPGPQPFVGKPQFRGGDGVPLTRVRGQMRSRLNDVSHRSLNLGGKGGYLLHRLEPLLRVLPRIGLQRQGVHFMTHNFSRVTDSNACSGAKGLLGSLPN